MCEQTQHPTAPVQMIGIAGGLRAGPRSGETTPTRPRPQPQPSLRPAGLGRLVRVALQQGPETSFLKDRLCDLP